MFSTDHSFDERSHPPAERAEHYRRQLQTVAENATLALFIMDEHQHCTYMNRAAEQLTGFHLAQVQGKPLHDIIHHTRPDGTHYPLEECPIDQAFPQNMREQGEEVFVHPDGHFYPVAFTASPIRDGDRTVGTIIEVRDITEEKREQAEREALLRALEYERSQLSRVLQQAPAFIATVRGPDHIFEMANEAYYQLVGHRGLIGRPVREAMPEVESQGFIELLDRVYQTGEPFNGNEIPVSIRNEADGAMREIHVNLTYQPLRDSEGQVTGVLAHAVDVSAMVEARRQLERQAVELEGQREEMQVQALHMEEVQAELEISNEELQQINLMLGQERAQLQAIIDHAPIGILIAEAPSGRIVTGNRRVEEIFRHPLLASEGVDEYEQWVAYHPDGRRVQGHEYPLGRVFLTGESAGPDEYLYQRGDGTKGWVQITGAPIKDEAGELTGGLVVIDDIDADKRAEQERERLIAALELERARLRDLFERAPALIAVLRGRELRYELANGVYLRSIGRDDVLGRTVREVVPEVEGQGYIEMLEGIFDSGQPVIGDESRVLIDRTGDGVLEETFFNFVFQPLRDPDGSVGSILIHAVEVTEQVRARRDVEQLEERLRLALEAAEMGAYDWDVVADELTWDANTRRIFGAPAEGPVDFGMFERALHPEDREAALAAVQNAMDPASTGEFTMEYRVTDREERLRWVRAAGRVTFEGEGELRRPVRFLGTVQDVSDRREAEAERERLLADLATGRARLEQIFAEAPAVMALYSGPEQIITMVNPTWERTVGKPNAVGRPFREVFPEFAGTGLYELLDQVYQTGEPFSDPEVNVPIERWGSGVLEDSYWHLVWRPLAGTGTHGRDILVHAVEVTTQVLARKAVEANAEELTRIARQLEMSNRELDQFAYATSHDLKAPLRGIANLASWIEEDMAEQLTEDAREHLELLKSRVHRMDGLIEGILQYSRAGRVRDKAEEVEVGALLEEVVELISPPEGVTVEVAPDMPVLVSERLPLQQVFMNLIGNAIKYNTGKEPRVVVTSEDAGERVRFRVRDNGPGIAPEYHARIFGIFQKLQGRDEVEGTGIGLSLVKKLVESRGGGVSVESREGEGATFVFTWPRVASDTPLPAEGAAAAPVA